MANVARSTMVVLMAFGTVMVAGPANAQEEPSAPGRRDGSIVLHVTNYAALSLDVLNVASARVALVYERIGVRVVWVDGEVSLEERQDGRRHFSILLLSRDMAEKKIKTNRIEDGVLGQAHVSAGRASIFCDRIAAKHGGPPHFSTSLGDIIAHEVGHLLLGLKSHSGTGIMRAHIDVRGLLPQGFDETQARTIRTTLRATLE